MTKKKAAVSRKRAKAKAPSRKPGRPSLYTEALAAKLCTRLAEGKSLRSICRDDAMPAISTVMGWLFDGDHDDFPEQYARAREAQAVVSADVLVDFADDDSIDFRADKDGKLVVDHEHIQRSRLRVDARKWIAAKLLPKRYGDKLQHTGEGGGPIRTEVDLTGIPTDVLRELRKLAARI